MFPSIYQFRCDFVDRGGCFMVLSGSDSLTGGDLDPIAAKMLQYNRIPRLLPVTFEEADLQLFLYYRIGEKKMLVHELPTRPFSKRELHFMLLQIAIALDESKNYMLSPERFLLHEGFIFLGNSWDDISLVYLPFKGVAGKKPLREELFELTCWAAKAGGLQNEQIEETLQYLREEPFQIRRWKSFLLKRCEQPETEKNYRDIRSPGREHERPLEVPFFPKEPMLQEKRTGFREVREKGIDVQEEVSVKGGRLSPMELGEWGISDNRAEHTGRLRIFSAKSKELMLLFSSAALGFAGLLAVGGWFWENDGWKGQTALPLALMAALLFASLFFVRRNRTGAEKGQGKEIGQGKRDEKERDLELRFSEEDLRFWFGEGPSGKEEGEEAANVPDTVFLSPPQPTVFLDVEEPSPPAQAFLLSGRGSDAVRVLIDRDSFLIGRDENAVHWREADAQVSRLHLEIRRENGRYWVKDLNSLNGSYLNGEKLVPYKSYELRDSDVIRFAGREMTFKTEPPR